MAGARIEVTVDDAEIRRVLAKLSGAVKDMSPLMHSIGEHLLNTTRERFVDQKAPDGTPWAPLSEATKRRKRRNRDKVLTERGFLRGNLAYRADATSVRVGSPSIYAGTHQFGAERGVFGTTGRGRPVPWGDIPARPFLGLSDADRDEVLRLAERFLRKRSSVTK